MIKNYWFKAKKHGYGWYPINWKGWLSIAGFISLPLIWAGFSLNPLVLFFCMLGALVILFFLVKKYGEPLK